MRETALVTNDGSPGQCRTNETAPRSTPGDRSRQKRDCRASTAWRVLCHLTIGTMGRSPVARGHASQDASARVCYATDGGTPVRCLTRRHCRWSWQVGRLGRVESLLAVTITENMTQTDREECSRLWTVTTTVPCQWYSSEGGSPRPYCPACVGKLRREGSMQSMFRVTSLESVNCPFCGKITSRTRSTCRACGRAIHRFR